MPSGNIWRRGDRKLLGPNDPGGAGESQTVGRLGEELPGMPVAKRLYRHLRLSAADEAAAAEAGAVRRGVPRI